MCASWKLFSLAPAGIQDRLRRDKNLDHFTPRAHHHIARGASFGGGAGVKSVQRPKLEIKRTRKRGSGRETLRDHRVPNILSPRSAHKTHLQERLAILGVGHAVGPGREALVSAPHDGLQVVWRQHDHWVERVVAHQAAQVLDVVRPETRTTPNVTFFCLDRNYEMRGVARKCLWPAIGKEREEKELAKFAKRKGIVRDVQFYAALFMGNCCFKSEQDKFIASVSIFQAYTPCSESNTFLTRRRRLIDWNF